MAALVITGLSTKSSSLTSFKLKIFITLALLCMLFIGFSSKLFANENQLASENHMKQGIDAYEAKMYGYSKQFFEKALEFDRSNYSAMLYLANANYYTKEYSESEKYCDSLISSFYPTKELKIKAFQLLADIYNKQNKPLRALAYIDGARQVSTNINLSHLVDEQVARIDFASMSYPEFREGSDDVITSKTLSYADGIFEEQSTTERFEAVTYSLRSLNTRYVVLPGFDDRLRFSKLLLIKVEGNLKPKLQEVDIQSRKRGGFLGTNDLYLKIMDWNFDGYPDWVVRVSPKTAGAKQAFLIFNPGKGVFEYNEALSDLGDPILDRASKAVIEEACVKGKDANCSRKRYKLFAGEYALAQFEKNSCAKTCIYTTAEIEVSSLRTAEHMYLVNTIETEFEALKSRFQSSTSGQHMIVTRRVLRAYYTANYDATAKDREIMMLDLDGSWEFPASYVKEWINKYFSSQPLDGQLGEQVLPNHKHVIN